MAGEVLDGRTRSAHDFGFMGGRGDVARDDGAVADGVCAGDSGAGTSCASDTGDSGTDWDGINGGTVVLETSDAGVIDWVDSGGGGDAVATRGGGGLGLGDEGLCAVGYCRKGEFSPLRANAGAFRLLAKDRPDAWDGGGGLSDVRFTFRPLREGDVTGDVIHPVCESRRDDGVWGTGCGDLEDEADEREFAARSIAGKRKLGGKDEDA